MTRQPLPFFENLNRSILPCLNSAISSLSHTRQAHAYILKSGVFNDTLFTTKLISQYANHSSFAEANLILNSIFDPYISSFSTLIDALNKFNLFTQLLNIFSKMLSHGVLPDTHVLPNVVKACDSVVQASSVHMYLKSDRIGDARNVFERLLELDVVPCGALLSAYARKGCLNEAKQNFLWDTKFGS
ncbi:hypothetical protein REPUB_Repub02eG0014700 [Reevesia pubescens]